MNPSRLFIERPVATSLLMIAILLSGMIAYRMLALSALPQVDYPTIQVVTFYPGASPDVMASSVTAPLERQFGQMPGLRQMSSSSSGGASVVTLQFTLDLELDEAVQSVQAAINAGANLLPTDLPAPPIYSKVNPADAPILTLGITSKTLPMTQVQNLADTRVAQKISQMTGVGLVTLSGGQRPAVRVQANPKALAANNLSMEDVRTAIAAANVNAAKGSFDGPERAYTIDANDQLQSAAEYKKVVVAYRNGAPVYLSNVADVIEDAENTRLAAWMNDTQGIIMNIQRQPGANLIEVVDRIKAMLPQLQGALPASVDVQVLTDRTVTIRASVKDVQFDLLLAVALVVMVIFLFLRNVAATLIPSVAVPLSLVGTFGVMYLAGFSINNLTLMALTIATGFVVDDAITLAVAILISAVVSLTLTPMMCARLLHHTPVAEQSRFYRVTGQWFDAIIAQYGRMLTWVLNRQGLTLIVAVATLALAVVLYAYVSKGFFPQQDTGVIQGISQAPQTVSFAAMAQRQELLAKTLLEDPAVESISFGRMSALQGQVADAILADPDVESLSSNVGVDGQNPALNQGRMLINLKPHAQRPKADTVLRGLQERASRLEGIKLFMQPVQDLTIEDRVSRTQYQYTLDTAKLDDLTTWTPRVVERFSQLPQLTDVASDLQNEGLQAYLEIDRDTAGRLGVTPASINTALYNAFGQRLISTIFTQTSQYRVVLEVKPEYRIGPSALNEIFVPTTTGSQIRMSEVTNLVEKPATLSINHIGQFPAATISFNLAPGVALGDAVKAIEAAERDLALPPSIRTSFQGAALAFRASLTNTLLLILAAIVTMYIVLGVLYESYIHPVTILSTLPSAGVGALLALILARTDLGIIGIIGIILLIGIVKKNAIMMIDFALDAERNEGKAPREAIYQACLLRFRPILMTTMAALLGALPLMIGTGVGSELRFPLGITMVGGLIVSQILTLFTTPVIYLAFDRLSRRARGEAPEPESTAAATERASP